MGLTGAVLSRARSTREELVRRRVRIPVAAGQLTAPTLYFLTPDFDTPSGGIRVMYQHVDGLNELGHRARVLHQHRDFRVSWFDNDTQVTDVSASSIGPQDVLVVPELCVDLLVRMPHPPRHIVLNQSGHLTWQYDAAGVDRHMRSAPDLLGVVAASELIERYVTYAYPGVAVRRVRNPLDPEIFHLGGGRRPKVLSYLPRRGRNDIDQVLRLLRGREALAGWTLRPLDGLDQHELADAFRSSRIVLNTPYQEGFGLPAAEAMACGAYVVGFDGIGGREFMLPHLCGVVGTGDVVALASLVEEVVRADDADDDWCASRGRAAAAFVSSTYSPAEFSKDLGSAYGDLLGGLP